MKNAQPLKEETSLNWSHSSLMKKPQTNFDVIFVSRDGFNMHNQGCLYLWMALDYHFKKNRNIELTSDELLATIDLITEENNYVPCVLDSTTMMHYIGRLWAIGLFDRSKTGLTYTYTFTNIVKSYGLEWFQKDNPYIMQPLPYHLEMIKEEEISKIEKMKVLINECESLESESFRLAMFLLAWLSPSDLDKLKSIEIPREKIPELREESKKLGGFDYIKNKYDQIRKEIDNKLSELAEYLEKKEFEIDELEDQLSEGQFLWLQKHEAEIKKHLKGIEP